MDKLAAALFLCMLCKVPFVRPIVNRKKVVILFETIEIRNNLIISPLK